MIEWIISSSLLILVVLVLRAAMGKRISAGLRYGLWAVVLVRLLVPVSFLAVTVPQLPVWEPPEAMLEKSIYILPVDSAPAGEAGIATWADGSIVETDSFGHSRLDDSGKKVVRYADRISPLELLGWVWIAGAASLGTVLAASNLRFIIRLRRVRRPLEGTSAPIPVYVAAGLPSPCLIGLLHPAIYVTEEAANTPAMLRHVLAHELTHYNHRDHLWSVLRGAALAVHWWNPLVWLAVVCSRRDGELACDEGALERLGDGERSLRRDPACLGDGKRQAGRPAQLCYHHDRREAQPEGAHPAHRLPAKAAGQRDDRRGRRARAVVCRRLRTGDGDARS